MAFSIMQASGELRRLRSDGTDGHAASLLPAARPASPVAFGAVSRTADAIRSDTDDLLRFLEADLPHYEDFLPACVSHAKKVVLGIDAAYTDAQLQNVLENECWLDKKFITVEDGFDHEEACKKFGKQLTDARMKELDSGSMEGYEDFCKDYYIHKGGAISEAKIESNTTEDDIFEKEYEKHYSKGRSNERARHEASKKVQEHKDKVAGSETEKKDRFPIWPVALVLVGIAAFILTGIFIKSRR
uniref:Uncharacterized protein n=1 Tax=Alexandrium catenella TaxID=2925 RepID=A0A7S1RFV1_ALECA